MVIRFVPITRSFLVQSRKFLYRDAQEMIIYQIGYVLGGLGALLNPSSSDAYIRARPSRESRRDSEISPKVPPMGGAFG